MTPERSWRLEVLGKARLVRPDGQLLRPDGLGLVLLAYLALEGPTPRSRLAGLLWPETPESSARNNLVHLIRRTNRAQGREVLLGGDSVSLAEDVLVDAHRLIAGQEEDAGLISAGPLLEGVDFDGRPDLADWLLAWRERLDGLRAERLGGLAARQEAAGDLAGALGTAARLLDLTPVSEEAWRRLIRLHYLAGDRGAALAAFERCRAALRREFGAEPLPETLALAREVGRGQPRPLAPARPRIPLSVLRPPSLVGRGAEWARMEEAWARGQVLLLAGEPGVGKSRLARDFALSRGEALHLEGRPGDALVPYSTTARSLRRILARTPDLPLEPWMRLSLARLLPELLDGKEAPPEPDPHLHAAIEHVFRVGLAGVGALVYDDLHLADPASVEAAFVLISSAFPLGQPGGVPGLIATVRPADLSPTAAGVVGQLVGAGQGVRLDLEPLGPEAVGALLGDLDVPAVRGMGPQLARFTGGNPLFLLETVKHLIETPSRDGTLPVAARVSQLIEGRLARLSPAALGAARGAAVLQSDLRIELVAEVLGTPLLDTAAAWEELEAAQVMSGERFSHDLMQETVVAGIPQAMWRLLNRSAARVLGREGASPARVGQHLLLGGDLAQAAPWLVRAAHDARRALRPLEAVAFFDQAARLYDELGDEGAAFATRMTAVEHLNRNEQDAAMAAMVERLHRDARTPAQVAQARWARAKRLLSLGRFAEADAALGEGLLALGRVDDPPLRAALLRELVVARAGLGGVGGTLEVIREAAALHERLGDPAATAQAEHAFGGALLRLGRFGEAAAHLGEAVRRFEEGGDPYNGAWSRYGLAEALEGAGQMERASALRGELEDRLRDRPAAPVLRYWNLVRLGVLATRSAEYARALGWLRAAEGYNAEVGESAGPLWRAFAHLYWQLGALGECEEACVRALEHRDERDWAGQLPWLLRGLVRARRGQVGGAHEAYGHAEAALRDSAFSYSRGALLLARAALAPAGEALELTTRALDLAWAQGHADLITAALCARAEVRLALGEVARAHEDSTAAAARWPEEAPRDDRVRPLLVHHRVLSALGDLGADVPLGQARAWLDRAVGNVPPEFRAAFLEEHATHRALRALARVRLPGETAP